MIRGAHHYRFKSADGRAKMLGNMTKHYDPVVLHKAWEDAAKQREIDVQEKNLSKVIRDKDDYKPEAYSGDGTSSEIEDSCQVEYSSSE